MVYSFDYLLLLYTLFLYIIDGNYLDIGKILELVGNILYIIYFH